LELVYFMYRLVTLLETKQPFLITISELEHLVLRSAANRPFWKRQLVLSRSTETKPICEPSHEFRITQAQAEGIGGWCFVIGGSRLTLRCSLEAAGKLYLPPGSD